MSCREACIIPVAFGALNLVQRPNVMPGDAVRLYVRADVPLAGAFGLATGRADGINRNPFSIFLANLAAPLGLGGYATTNVASVNGRPIIVPGYAGLESDVVVDLRGTVLGPADEGAAWLHVLPPGTWGV